MGSIIQHHCIAGDIECRKDEDWQMALGMLADMTESTMQGNAITRGAGGSACRKNADGVPALGLLAEMAEFIAQHNTITA